MCRQSCGRYALDVQPPTEARVLAIGELEVDARERVARGVQTTVGRERQGRGSGGAHRERRGGQRVQGALRAARLRQARADAGAQARGEACRRAEGLLENGAHGCC